MSEAPASPIAALAAGINRRAILRRYALRGLAFFGALLLFFGLAFGLTFSLIPLAIAAASGLGALFSFLALLIANVRSRPRLASATIAIRHGGLRLSGAGKRERTFPLASVVQGHWEDPDLVHLAMKNGEILVVRVTDAAEGERLLRTAGVTATERVLRVPLASAASQIPGGSAFGGGLLAISGAGLFFTSAFLAVELREMAQQLDASTFGGFSIVVTIAAFFSLAVYALASALRRREAVVGTDGVLYQRSLRAEFIPYTAIESVLPDTRGVRLVRKDGRRVLLPTRGAGGRPLPLAPQTTPPKTPAEVQRRVLFERIHQAMASGGSSELAQVALDRLDRNGRPFAAWRDELHKLLTSEGDYRSLRVSTEELGGVIVDAAAPAERRIAAAVALSARESGEARRRVRIAVQACADEDLQRALESAAEGEIDEASLTRAMSRRVDGRSE